MPQTSFVQWSKLESETKAILGNMATSDTFTGQEKFVALYVGGTLDKETYYYTFFNHNKEKILTNIFLLFYFFIH